jgi:hypothetical protein
MFAKIDILLKIHRRKMRYLTFLLSIISLATSAQRAHIREIRVPVKPDTLVYPLIVTADPAASRAINRTIKATVFDAEDLRLPVTSLIRQSVKDYHTYDIDYTVTRNENDLLSLTIHMAGIGAHEGYSDFYFNFDTRTGTALQLKDLISPDMIDSFRNMVLHEKQRYLTDYINDLSSDLASKQIDSVEYSGAKSLVEEDCIDSVHLDQFSLKTQLLEVMDPCEFPYVIRAMTPEYQLLYSYTTLTPFLKPAFRTRIAAVQPGYRLIRFTSPHNSFPDTARDAGHLDGDHVFQPKKGHYDDSSVLLVIPNSFKPNQPIDLVFWYHGWHNNIDTALRFYGLARQFAASGVNAILVLPEAGKNVADSYGGKMNQLGMFGLLVQDVMTQLKKQHIASESAPLNNITIGGHSGAFLVIANILDNNALPINEVFLFDALYSHVPSFMNWIAKDPKQHHFIHWFTNKGGGTDEVSDTMMTQLRQKGWPFRLVEENAVTPAILQNNNILFIHSLREHNVIINDPDDFRLLLENSNHLTR